VRNHTRRHRVAWLSAALAALVLAFPATLALSTSAAVAAGSNTLTVKAGEFVYQLKGSPKAGWTKIDFDNAGVEDHMMAVFKVKKGTTGGDVKKAITADKLESIALPGGDPTLGGTPGVLGPDQKTTTYTQIPAGTYAIVCFVATTDGSLHANHGMYKVFTVSGKSNLTPPSSADVADVAISDTAFTVPSANAPRDTTIKVTNNGTTPHGFQLVKLNAGKTLDDAKTYFDALINDGKAEGEAPGELVGGVEGIAPNSYAYLEWTLPAGSYGYLSVGGDDPPNDDYTKGLHGTFTIS
jgi:hypothetical protein